MEGLKKDTRKIKYFLMKTLETVHAMTCRTFSIMSFQKDWVRGILVKRKTWYNWAPLYLALRHSAKKTFSTMISVAILSVYECCFAKCYSALFLFVMHGLHSKLVCLSKLMKVADNGKDTRLLINLSIFSTFWIYSVLWYGIAHYLLFFVLTNGPNATVFVTSKSFQPSVM